MVSSMSSLEVERLLIAKNFSNIHSRWYNKNLKKNLTKNLQKSRFRAKNCYLRKTWGIVVTTRSLEVKGWLIALNFSKKLRDTVLHKNRRKNYIWPKNFKNAFLAKNRFLTENKKNEYCDEHVWGRDAVDSLKTEIKRRKNQLKGVFSILV